MKEVLRAILHADEKLLAGSNEKNLTLEQVAVSIPVMVAVTLKVSTMMAPAGVSTAETSSVPPMVVEEQEVKASMPAESSARPAQMHMFLFTEFILLTIGWFALIGLLFGGNHRGERASSG